MTKLTKQITWLFIILVIVFFVYIAVGSYAVSTMFSGIPDSTYSKKELIENYNKNETQILELKKYFNSIVKKGKFIEIEFENEKTLSRFGVSSIDTITGVCIYPGFLDWDLQVSSKKVDSVITSIGWTKETLITIKQKLDKAHCIEIESGEPTKIGFQRSGMGMFFYNVFENPIADSLKKIITIAACLFFTTINWF